MSSFKTRVDLGRTGLKVSRLGIGSSYGVSPRACRRAFDKGINYFFWGSIRTRGMGVGLREIGREDRESLVLVLQSYARSPFLLRRSVETGLRSLGFDYADVLLLGWHDSQPAPRLVETALRLKESGSCRFLGISGHDRATLRSLVVDQRFDVVHLRYNAAHRGAEIDVFPYLEDVNRPGIVSFTNTRWGDLLDPAWMPKGTSPASALDCYRFALTNPFVDVAVAGPGDDRQMDEALAVLDSGPLSDEELRRMRILGDHVHATKSLRRMIY